MPSTDVVSGHIRKDAAKRCEDNAAPPAIPESSP